MWVVRVVSERFFVLLIFCAVERRDRMAGDREAFIDYDMYSFIRCRLISK